MRKLNPANNLTYYPSVKSAFQLENSQTKSAVMEQTDQ